MVSSAVCREPAARTQGQTGLEKLAFVRADFQALSSLHVKTYLKRALVKRERDLLVYGSSSGGWYTSILTYPTMQGA